MKMLINGSWCDAKSGEVIEILNPSNSEIIDTVPRGRVEDVEEAVQAALKGYEINRGISARERSAYLLKAADLIDVHHDEIRDILIARMVRPTTGLILRLIRWLRSYGPCQTGGRTLRELHTLWMP